MGTILAEILQLNKSLATQFQDTSLLYRPPVRLKHITQANCICTACNEPTTRCNFTLHLPSPISNLHLPKGWILVCAGMAYYIIPKPFTGLCTVGKLGLLTIPPPATCYQRELPHLSPHCDDNVVLTSDRETAPLTLSLIGLSVLGKSYIVR